MDCQMLVIMVRAMLCCDRVLAHSCKDYQLVAVCSNVPCLQSDA
jgi:hypothetical protein